MKAPIVSTLPPAGSPIEMVERKGLGHPDSICDRLAETLSRNLCRAYLETFGEVLHHNVDKALLCGGRSAPAFGGGRVLAPIDIHLSGRAVTQVSGKTVPIRELAIDGSREWLRDNLHALDADRHVRLHDGIRPGSMELAALFARRPDRRTPLANDTSIGVGFAPMSALERLVLEIERQLNGRRRALDRPAWGEDIKVMGVRQSDSVYITVACAMIDSHLTGLPAYLSEIHALRERVDALATAAGFDEREIVVNAADDLTGGAVYLTVTGTSAEAGDDGEVGRGNRINGLITPYRPMSLEAAAGKNPVSHVGKIYNVLARRIAERLVTGLPVVAAAECYLVSRIGQPVTDPTIAHVRIATRDGTPAETLKRPVEEVVSSELEVIPELLDAFVAGTIDVV